MFQINVMYVGNCDLQNKQLHANHCLVLSLYKAYALKYSKNTRKSTRVFLKVLSTRTRVHLQKRGKYSSLYSSTF